MNKKMKIWLLAAGALVLLGCLLFTGVMAAQDWDFTRLSTVQYETNTYEIREDFRDIAVTTNTANITFALSDDGLCRVECYEAESEKHSVAVEHDTLVIQTVDPGGWYAQVGICFETPRITVYLPGSQYRALTVSGSTGAIELSEIFTFDSAEIASSTGNVVFCASVSGSASIKTAIGDIRAEHVSAGALDLAVATGQVTVSGVTCQGDLTVDVTTGEASLRDVSCRNLISNGNVGSITLEHVTASEQFLLERSTGHVNFTACDAAELHVKTDTGNVTGSLRSDKIFFAESDVGTVNMPKTMTGGICEIQTDTGNITITID